MADCLPDAEAIKRAISEAIHERHLFVDRHDAARAVFSKWRQVHTDPCDSWRHGTGKKANALPPDPDQTNPYSSFQRYMTGRAPQNLRGWEMVADLLEKRVEEILHPGGRMETMVAASIKPFGAVMSPGDLPLANLATVEVIRPQPRQGANAVSADSERRQAIALTARAIFNTIRREEFCAPDGSLIAVADMELRHAYLIVRVSDPSVAVLSGIGTEGKVVFQSIEISYLGTESELVVFEVAPTDKTKTLAGTVQRLEDLVELQGRFTDQDYIGAAIDKNGIQLVNVEFEGNIAKSDERPISLALKQQLLARGIQLTNAGSSTDERRVTARRYFMRSVIDEPEL
ncbi:hypothetical protein C8J36_11412 [Rhizobium sp. PP-F2F-G48]|uniref:hypothetical protein n=1 Tax=Rhizobium sp. PP-F2F-G48 TaxID=2135651 RepID=UPI00104EA78E|nr:hypothetical protein [Rhizobium sp. PP-F2F-G48]TCM48315.1 hypothetical protein C8J36_11412 [Rhizobium sp. PP-F2F-G48]